MHKITFTVKDLEGFSFSVDSDSSKGNNVETPFDNGAFHITREQAEEMAFGELVQELSVGSAPCVKCGKPVTSNDCVSAYIVYDFTGDNPEAVVLCPACESSNPDRRIRSIKLNGWHQRNNPGGPDETPGAIDFSSRLGWDGGVPVVSGSAGAVPTATIARSDFDELIAIREKLGINTGVQDTTDGVPILAENYVEKNGGWRDFADMTENTRVAVKVTLQRSAPCHCRLDLDGKGPLCPDVDENGCHTTIVSVPFGDVLSKLGFDIDHSAFLMAAMIAAGFDDEQPSEAPF